MALYPYTLQPVALNISEKEFIQAQTALFKQSTPSFGLSSIKLKEWIFMSIATILGISGIFFINGYSTIIFWLLLIGVILYLAIRTLGMKWYVEKEFKKQLHAQEMPDELSYMKLGVQKNGLIISMPTAKNPNLKTGKSKNKAKRGMQTQMPKNQQAVVSWDCVTGWDETDQFLFVMFTMQGQAGSQIIPKRMLSDKFPIDTVINHLKEVREKGIEPATTQPELAS